MSTTPMSGARFPGSALAVAALASLGVLIGWEFVLALNKRLSPHVPWYPLAAVLVVVALWTALRSRWMPRGLVAREPVDLRIATCVVSGAISCLGLNLLLTKLSPFTIASPTRESLTGTALAPSYAIVASLFAAVVEEVIFRGVVQPALESYAGIIRATLVTSVLFVLAHAGNALFVTQWPFYFLCSVFFGFVAWRTESMLYPIVSHAAVNLTGNLLLLWCGTLDRTSFPGILGIGLLTATALAATTAVFADRKGAFAKYLREHTQRNK